MIDNLSINKSRISRASIGAQNIVLKYLSLPSWDYSGLMWELNEASRFDPFCERLINRISMSSGAVAEVSNGVRTPQVVMNEPIVAIRSNLLGHLECAYLAENSLSMMVESMVVESGESVLNGDFRRSSTRFLVPSNMDNVEYVIISRLYSRLGVSQFNVHAPNVVRYTAGGIFKAHFDHIFSTATNPQPIPRSATNIVYLNNNYEGGETAFVRAGQAVRGDIGDGVRFRNIKVDSLVDPLSLHASLPVVAGEKWILVLWEIEDSGRP